MEKKELEQIIRHLVGLAEALKRLVKKLEEAGRADH
jgi:hypothetical protein